MLSSFWYSGLFHLCVFGINGYVNLCGSIRGKSDGISSDVSAESSHHAYGAARFSPSFKSIAINPERLTGSFGDSVPHKLYAISKANSHSGILQLRPGAVL